MAVVVFKMIALVLEGIEGLIFNLPAGATAPHQLKDIGCRDREIGDPAKMLDFVPVNFPIFNEVDQQVRVRGVQRDLIDEPKSMNDPFHLAFVLGHLTGLVGRGDRFKQKGVVAFFDPHNVAQVVLFEFLQMGRIGAEGIFGDNEGPLRVVLAQLAEKTLGRIAWYTLHGHKINFFKVIEGLKI